MLLIRLGSPYFIPVHVSVLYEDLDSYYEKFSEILRQTLCKLSFKLSLSK